MKLSIVIPCYNEVNTIETIVRAVRAAAPQNKEIIIVDDFSTDGTREKIVMDIAPLVDRVILHDRNRGKGAALRSGFAVASGEIIVVQDADLEYDPQDYPLLMEPILSGKADVVYGSRFISHRPHRVLFFWHYLGNKFLTTLSNMFTNLNLTDMETCYKMFKREVILALTIEEERFGFEPEITAKVARMNLRIYEVGISYHGRSYAEGKKINWRDGFRAIYVIIKYNIFKNKHLPSR